MAMAATIVASASRWRGRCTAGRLSAELGYLVEEAVPEIGNRSGLFDGENAGKLVVKL